MQRGSSFCRVSSMKASCTQSSGESVHWAAKRTSAPPCSSSRRLRASGVSSGLTRFLPLSTIMTTNEPDFPRGREKNGSSGPVPSAGLGGLNLEPSPQPPYTAFSCPLAEIGPSMHTFDDAPPASKEELADNRPWYALLTKYHWFVLAVCALGWLFDCLDQQLFILARPQAMEDLLGYLKTSPDYKFWTQTFGDISTSVFIAGWASGGLIFGMLGDRIGRAKTMML